MDDEGRYGVTPSNSHDGSEPTRVPHMQQIMLPDNVRQVLDALDDWHLQAAEWGLFGLCEGLMAQGDAVLLGVVLLAQAPGGAENWRYDRSRGALVHHSVPDLRDWDDLDL